MADKLYASLATNLTEFKWSLTNDQWNLFGNDDPIDTAEGADRTIVRIHWDMGMAGLSMSLNSLRKMVAAIEAEVEERYQQQRQSLEELFREQSEGC